MVILAEPLNNALKYTDSQFWIFAGTVGYFLYDAASKKFEDNAIIFKLYRWIVGIFKRHEEQMEAMALLSKGILDIKDDSATIRIEIESVKLEIPVIKNQISLIKDEVKAVRAEVAVNGGSVLLKDIVIEMKGRQFEIVGLLNGIKNTQKINDNIRLANVDLDSIPRFVSSPTGELLDVNKAWLKFVGVEDKKTVLGMGFLKVLSPAQVTELKLQQMLNGTLVTDFDGVLKYINYTTKKPMEGKVTTTIIYDIDNEPILILGQVIPQITKKTALPKVLINNKNKKNESII